MQPAKNGVHDYDYDYEKRKCINGGSGEDLVEIYVVVGELVQLAAKLEIITDSLVVVHVQMWMIHEGMFGMLTL